MPATSIPNHFSDNLRQGAVGAESANSVAEGFCERRIALIDGNSDRLEEEKTADNT